MHTSDAPGGTVARNAADYGVFRHAIYVGSAKARKRRWLYFGNKLNFDNTDFKYFFTSRDSASVAITTRIQSAFQTLKNSVSVQAFSSGKLVSDWNL